MKIKKFILPLLFINAVFSYASMSVSEFSDAPVNSTYVVHETGVTVYSAPSLDSEKITFLPPGTQVLFLSLNGPSHKVKAWWDDPSEKYVDCNWSAILLPPDLRTDDNIMGWIETCDYTWWSYPEEFSTEEWTKETLEAYLKNSIWYLSFEPDEFYDGPKNAICVFDEGEYSVFFYDDGKRSSHKDTYSVNSANSLTMYGEQIEDLKIDSYEFSFKTDEGYFNFKKINLASLDSIPEYNDSKKCEQARALIYKASKKYFRIFSRDYYTEANIMDYTMKGECDKALRLLAVTAGVDVDIDNKSWGDYGFNDYWVKIIRECEESVKKGRYTFTLKDQKPLYLLENHTYVTDDRLRLRKNEDTSSEIITTMEKGTEVKVLEYGKFEVIDGAAGYWVYVQPKGSKKKGWCFGGFLEEKN